MRLTTTEAGFLDATPIIDRKIGNMSIRKGEFEEFINKALNFYNNNIDNENYLRVQSVIHTLFLSYYSQSLQFESFNYLYIAIDTCFKIVFIFENTSRYKPPF